jgi:hypothetical protein
MTAEDMVSSNMGRMKNRFIKKLICNNFKQLEPGTICSLATFWEPELHLWEKENAGVE